jgi:hypothetical protein
MVVIACDLHLSLEVVDVLLRVLIVDFHFILQEQSACILVNEANAYLWLQVSLPVQLSCLHECLPSGILGTQY